MDPIVTENKRVPVEMLLSAVQNLDLDPVIIRRLHYHRIERVGELVQKSQPQMRRLRYLGETSLQKIKHVLATKGLSLGMQVPEWEQIEARAHKKDAAVWLDHTDVIALAHAEPQAKVYTVDEIIEELLERSSDDLRKIAQCCAYEVELRSTASSEWMAK